MLLVALDLVNQVVFDTRLLLDCCVSCLSWWQCGDAGGIALAEALHVNTVLLELDLGSNHNMGDAAVTRWRSSFREKFQSSYHDVVCVCMCMLDTIFPDALARLTGQAMAFVECFSTCANQSLRVLSLLNNKITDKGSHALKKCVEEHCVSTFALFVEPAGAR